MGDFDLYPDGPDFGDGGSDTLDISASEPELDGGIVGASVSTVVTILWTMGLSGNELPSRAPLREVGHQEARSYRIAKTSERAASLPHMLRLNVGRCRIGYAWKHFGANAFRKYGLAA